MAINPLKELTLPNHEDIGFPLRFLAICLFLIISGQMSCSFADPPANPPEDFVRASVVITAPGTELYACTGHAFFRMQCPSHDMDYCFSYESEPVRHRVLTFLSGNLRMGMTVLPTGEFLEQYAEEQRGVWEYPLNLPIEVKQELWRALDNHVDEGMELPYDYLERGCAVSVFHILQEALGSRRLVYGALPPQFTLTRRELLSSQLDHAPWSRLTINILTNGSANEEVPDTEKCITPRSLIDMLQATSLNGTPLLGTACMELVSPGRSTGTVFCTPMAVGVLIMILTLVCVVIGKPWMLYFLTCLQTLLGILNVYLIFFSSLCATEWSWLLIPFNPLPVLFWKWRKIWEVPFSMLIAVWCVAMVLAPHSLTDPALIVIAMALSGAYAADRIPVADIIKKTFSSKKFTNLKIYKL